MCMLCVLIRPGVGTVELYKMGGCAELHPEAYAKISKSEKHTKKSIVIIRALRLQDLHTYRRYALRSVTRSGQVKRDIHEKPNIRRRIDIFNVT